MSKNTRDYLEEVTVGLLYPSETDAPFEIFRWSWRSEPTGTQLAAYFKKPQAKIAEISIADFFNELSDSPNAKRFRTLQENLEQNLKRLKIYRVGEIEIDVYIVGQAVSGEWLGLRTKSIET